MVCLSACPPSLFFPHVQCHRQPASLPLLPQSHIFVLSTGITAFLVKGRTIRFLRPSLCPQDPSHSRTDCRYRQHFQIIQTNRFVPATTIYLHFCLFFFRSLPFSGTLNRLHQELKELSEVLRHTESHLVNAISENPQVNSQSSISS